MDFKMYLIDKYGNSPINYQNEYLAYKQYKRDNNKEFFSKYKKYIGKTLVMIVDDNNYYEESYYKIKDIKKSLITYKVLVITKFKDNEEREIYIETNKTSDPFMFKENYTIANKKQIKKMEKIIKMFK